MSSLVIPKTALISVYYKEGLEDLCRKLHEKSIRLYATGGTATFLSQGLGIAVTKVESLTHFPEMMDGRVKTLHPRIFGGILARRENPKDMKECEEHEIPLFDLVVANLYPYAEHLGESAQSQTSFIDIGGPCLLRAAAKNFSSVTVVSDPSDYSGLISELEANAGATSVDYRKQQAAKTFQRTSAYDALIASEWSETFEFPKHLALSPVMALRYGENPHQKAAWCGVPSWTLLQGKELSFNNLLDAESAMGVVAEFSKPCIGIVKHNNPCGVALGSTPSAQIFSRAFEADNQSAFGGIVASNFPIDAATAEAMSAIFLEVVLAPDFSSEALAIFSKKKNLRLIRWPHPTRPGFDARRALGGWLVQDADSQSEAPPTWKVVTETQVPPASDADLKFAWSVCKHVRSNAIVLAKDLVTLGVGAGQMSRVDAVGIALNKAHQKLTPGTVLASDAFFPFRDNIDKLKGTGVTAIVQPGGSQRDPEVIQACNEAGISMIFTGQRHFRH